MWSSIKIPLLHICNSYVSRNLRSHIFSREALILSSNPLDPEADWFCGDCGDVRKAESIRKLNEYFVNAIMEAGLDCSGLEDLLTKSTRMFHPNHYVPTLIRIKLNTAYLRLGARNEGEAETELLMRRKELLDEVHQVNWKLINSTECKYTVLNVGGKNIFHIQKVETVLYYSFIVLYFWLSDPFWCAYRMNPRCLLYSDIWNVHFALISMPWYWIFKIWTSLNGIFPSTW